VFATGEKHAVFSGERTRLASGMASSAFAIANFGFGILQKDVACARVPQSQAIACRSPD